MSHKHTTTLDPTKPPPPTEYSSDPRSRSRSRTRYQSSSHESDPLLSNLSPTSTLEAFSYTELRPAETRKASSELQESIAGASSSERALGIRAASAAKKLKEWHAEVLGWAWPGSTEDKNGFEVPNAGDRDAELGARDAHGQNQSAGADKEQEYWGSLPRQIVEGYEERIEIIADAMEALDVEELKSHVLEAHMPSRSRSASTSHQQEASLETAGHNHLDDFTAVVTATILQALPYVARLNILLHTWSVRFAVLRQVPGFLRALEDASTAIISGWSSISVSGTSIPGYSTGISREAFNIMQPILEDRLTAAGQRLDRMLDALEGREDTVPKQWIDEMEMLEADYSNWFVEAEKKVLENELRQYRREQHGSQHQPTDSKENVQKPPSPSEHPPMSGDESTDTSPKDNGGSHSIKVQPSSQASELSNSSVATDLSSSPSSIDFRRFDKERLMVRQKEKVLPDEVENDMAQDGVTVLSLEARSTPSGESSLPIAASPVPASTVKGLVASIHSADMKIPSDTQDQELSSRAHNSANHHSEDSDATAARQHGKPQFNGSKHSRELSHEADSRLLIDYEDNEEAQPVEEVQPGTLISDPLPPGSFDPEPESPARNTLQTDGATESQIPQRNPYEHTDQSLSNAGNDHGSGENPTYGYNSITSPRSTVNLEPAPANQSSLPEESNASTSLDDAPRLAPETATESNSDTTVNTATSLPMPGSWDEEGVDTARTENTATLTQPSSGILGSKTLVDPGAKPTSPPHDGPGENGHKHIVERIVTENRPGRPTALPLLSHIPHADQSTPSEHSQPGSATSDFYSNASSPEIRDARAAQSFGKPVEVTSPIRLSGKRDHDRSSSDTWSPSQQTVRASHDLPSQAESRVSTTPVLQRNRDSNFALEPTIHEDAVGRHIEGLSHEGDDRDTEMRRASIASIEVLSRKEVKSINVRRRSGSYSSQPMPSGPLVEASRQSTPTSSMRRANRTDTIQDDKHSDSPLSPLVPTFNAEELSPLARKSKQRNEELGGHKTTPGSFSTPIRSARPTASSSRSQDARLRPWRRGASEPLGDDTNRVNKPAYLTSPTKSTEDQLEEKISSILTTIPARIRLTSGPDANAPEVVRPRSLSGTKRPDILSPAMRSSRNSAEGPSLTLAPAYAKSSPSSASSGDPEIRLYHLHQAGKDVPIKLYVRLVGEYGERVMVRVGGGWADLGEYLKEYANHHGRRSVSDGRFEIKGLPQGHSTSSLTTLAGLSSTPTSRPGSALGRPASALSVRKSRFSSGSPADFAMPSTPDQSSNNLNDMTPGSTDSYNISVRPSSRSSWTGEDAPLGLAGPKSRRIEVSPGKQAWVDGMMQQAKRASAERKKTDENLFGDLGKVGGTKRVFMRSSKDV